MTNLDELGKRICIIGPSNSGKSTLAQRLGKKINAKVLHLDQIAHVPNTNWERCDNTLFISKHNSIIAQESWIIDGNYSICMLERFERASSVIWLDPPLLGCLYRYAWRSLLHNPQRPGRLENATNEFSLKLVKYTLFNYPKNKVKYQGILDDVNLPIVRVHSMRLLNKYTTLWELPSCE